MVDEDSPRKKRKKFTIKPIIERKRVITRFILEDPDREVLRKRNKRAITSNEIRKSYAQITKFQLDDARFKYDDFKAYIELNQFSEAKRTRRRRKLKADSK